MSEVIFIRGVPASGKTTLAKTLIAERTGLYLVSKDDIRRSLCYGKTYGECDLFLVEEIRNDMIRACVRRGYDVVMDETFIEVEDINRAMSCIGDQHTLSLYDLSMVSPSECVKRDREREHPVGTYVIADAYRRLRKHDQRMDELIRPFDSVEDGRTETWPLVILS